MRAEANPDRLSLRHLGIWGISGVLARPYLRKAFATMFKALISGLSCSTTLASLLKTDYETPFIFAQSPVTAAPSKVPEVNHFIRN